MPQLVIQFIIAVALAIISSALAPSVHTDFSGIKDLSSPTADAGRPIPVLFGKMKVKGLNVIGCWDKETYKFAVS